MTIRRAARISLLIFSPSFAAFAQTTTAKIVSAANSFLSTLNEKQRQSTLFAFGDEQQRKRWSNFPVSMVPRSGVSLKEMSASQRVAAMTLISSALSPRGFEKVRQIMDGDEVLKSNESNGPGTGRGGGAPSGGPRLLFGGDLYFLSILGTPSEKSPWMLQFGGHHLALNITIAGAQGILTPTLTGAQPALYKMNGKTVRPLGQESDQALALLNALDENQRKQAILSYRLADLVLGPGQDGKTIQPEGLKASTMNEKQRAMLIALIAEWAGIVHAEAAAKRMAELRQEINDTWFSWSGPISAEAGGNVSAYYRIQGPHVVIEYAPQVLGGNPALHVHTMYRDPTNDYGAKLMAK